MEVRPSLLLGCVARACMQAASAARVSYTASMNHKQFVVVGMFAVSAIMPSLALAGSSPTGTFDVADSAACQVLGWAKDPDTTTSISVHIYRDAEYYDGGTFVASPIANILRTDLPFSDQQHGFSYSFDTNSGLRDGADHKLFVYGIDATGDVNAELNTSPRIIHCAAPVVQPTLVNVRDYGAKGDGIADDAPAIQKAIAALADTGGTVSIPAGIYMLGTSAGGVGKYPNGQQIQNAIIINKPRVVLKGGGIDTTILKLMPHAKMRALIITGNSVTVDGMTIDGNKSQRDDAHGWPDGDVVDALAGAWNAPSPVFQNCEVRNGIEDGVGFYNSDNAIMQHCYNHDNGTTAAGATGVSIAVGKGGAKILNSRLENNSAGIWSSLGAGNVTIQGNTIKNSVKSGIAIDGTPAGVGVGNASGFTISNNTITGNGSAGFNGIDITLANNGTIANNAISNNVFGSVVINDGAASSPSTGWTITGNTCSNQGMWGMNILGRASGIILRGNTCGNNGKSIDDQIVVASTAGVNSDWKTANTLSFNQVGGLGIYTPPAGVSWPATGSGSATSSPASTASALATSSNETQNNITALLARIQYLRAILAQLQSGTFSGSVVPGNGRACVALSRTLARGARGTDVSSLQGFLIAQGSLAADSRTGYFGLRTEAAVQHWQAAHGIITAGTPETTGYGVVGPKTRAAMACKQ